MAFGRLPYDPNVRRPNQLLMPAALISALLCLGLSPTLSCHHKFWTMGHTQAVVVLVVGAGTAGWTGVKFPIAPLAAIGGSFFTVWLPSRDIHELAYGKGSLIPYLVHYILFVVVLTVICRVVAGFANTSYLQREAARQRRDYYCTKCRYDLRGLPESRCPECGTPFLHSPPSLPLFAEEPTRRKGA